MIGVGDLTNRFAYHRPSENKATAHGFIRDSCLDLAQSIDAMVPDGREKSLAITALEEAMMWANAGIARNEITDQAIAYAEGLSS